jgi:hypothetical protein
MNTKTEIAGRMLRFLDRGMIPGQELDADVAREFPEFHDAYRNWVAASEAADKALKELNAKRAALLEAAPNHVDIEETP